MKKLIIVLSAFALWGAVVTSGNGATQSNEAKVEMRIEAPSSKATLGFSALFTIAIGLLVLRRQSAGG